MGHKPDTVGTLIGNVFTCVLLCLWCAVCAGMHVFWLARVCVRACACACVCLCVGVHAVCGCAPACMCSGGHACACARVRARAYTCAPACMCASLRVRVRMRVRRRACARRCAHVRARAFSSSPRARNASERADNCATSHGLGKTEEGCPVLLEGLALQRLSEDVRGVVGRLDVNGLDEAVAHEVADVQVPGLDVLGRCVGHRVV